MALVSNIVIDLLGKTATLTATVSSNSVETILYTDSGKTVQFATRAAINITGKDLLDFLAQIVIFESAIIFNFSPNASDPTALVSVDGTEAHDSILNKWNLTCIYGATPRVVSYSADLATKTVDLTARASPKTIAFIEWQYLLASLNFYRQSVKTYFGL